MSFLFGALWQETAFEYYLPMVDDCIHGLPIVQVARTVTVSEFTASYMNMLS